MYRLTRFVFNTLFLLSFLVTLSPILPVRPAYAAGIIVNSNADDTLANLDANATCDLREAITNANNDAATYPDCTAGTGTDTITFAGNYIITLVSSLPDITDADGVTITGNGTTNTIVQAAASAGTATYRIVKVNGSGVSATLEYMTLRYGVEASGGAINVASASLTLNHVTISDNQVKTTGGSTLNGGAISINGGTLTINNSTLSSNSIVETDSSTTHGNGGAIFVGGGTVNLNNVTISGNSAKRGGGGIYSNGGTVNINYSTIANNTSDSDNDSVGDGGGIIRNAGTINLKGSIVAGNKKATTSSTDNDCSGTIAASADYNLTGSSTGCSLSGTGNVTITPATVFTSLLGLLADNGGQTSTHALIAGSSAIDAIPNGTNGCGSGSFTQDQRGGARPYNSSCDIGAYEKHQLSVSTTGTDSGNCQITDCLTIAYAYGQASSGDTINVAAGTYTETSEIVMNPSTSRNITITGAGSSSTFWQMAASAGTASHRHFKLSTSNMTLTVQNLTLRYGVEASGGSINLQAGTLTLNNVTISDNQVNNSTGTGLNGGAISMNGGTLTINNSTLITNSVTTSDTSSSVRGSGGAIFVGSGTLTLNNTTISGNSAIRGGGGLFANSGTININYSTIANNTSNNADGSTAYSSLDGGGINRAGGTINLKSSIVAGNKKGVSGATDNDCNGTITSQGYNLTGAGTGCSLSGTGDVTVSPSTIFTNVLGPLANNGGNTYTHLLYGGSNTAHDAIPNGTNSCGSGSFNQDQRGSTRPYNGNCDMGAYENQDAVPTVSMSSTASNPTNTSPLPITVTFSESVTGFTSGDITTGNATVSNFSGSGASYSFNLTPSSDGTVTADIAAGIAQDSFGNYNIAASQFSRSYDGTPPPAPVVNSPANGSSTSDTTPSISGAAEANITLAIYLDNSLSGSTTADASGSWTYTPSSALSAGTHTVKAKASDAVGNSSVDSNTNTFTVDTTVPTVTSIVRSSTNPSDAASVDFLVGFSEGSLSGLDTSDFTLTTTGASSGASVTNVSAFAALLWTVTVNTGSSDGTIRLDLTDDDTIADTSGNKLGGTGTGNGNYTAGQTFTVDTISPTVAMNSTASDPTNAVIPVTVTFSESVSDFTSGDITIGNATLSNFAGSGSNYSFDLTPAGAGLVTADIAANVAQDTIGNFNTAAAQFSRTYVTAPEITLLGNNTVINDGDASPSVDDHTDFGDVTLGEAITHTFTISNSGNLALTLSGSSLITFTGPAAGDFSVVIEPTSSVATNTTTLFQVRFEPSIAGTRVATVTIPNNDSNENPYNFAIQGVGTAASTSIYLPLILR